MHSRNVYRLLLVIVALILVTTSAYALGTQGSADQGPGDDEPEKRVGFHRQTGLVSFLGVDPEDAIAQKSISPQSQMPNDHALAALVQFGGAFGLKDVSDELQLGRQYQTDDGRFSIKYQQVYQDVPVLFGELIVNLDGQGRTISINGEVSPDLTISTTPEISPGQASSVAKEGVAKWYELSVSELNATIPELGIYDPRLLHPSSRPAQLVWRIEVAGKNRLDINELVLVDALTGGIPLHYNQVHFSLVRKIYDHNNNPGIGLPGPEPPTRSEGSGATGIPDVDLAYDFSGDTYDYFFNEHGRDSLDDAGMELISTVRYCPSMFECPYQNAGWNGAQMVYGDGYAAADDVVGHELTHGVTTFSSGLAYYYESGAINESLSDIWGEFIDQTNGVGSDGDEDKWLIGEDLPPSIGVIRDMAHPPNYNDPDRMTSPHYFETSFDMGTPSADYGGVHTNSGVNNKAAYLMTEGDTFNGETITGLGISKVSAIYYEAQTNYLTSGSGYADLYNYLFQSCLNLIGGPKGITSEDCIEVRKAVDAVEMNHEPAVNYNPDAEVCPSTLITNNLFFDDLESGSSNWTFGTVSGTSSWIWDFGYSSSGNRMLWGDDSKSTSDSYARMTSNVSLPGGSQPYLHFNHAFGLEESGRDGGWLEYSLNDGGWVDAAPLFNAGMDYTGTIGGGTGNPNPGQAAFVSDSHGYVSSRYDLSSLAGNNIRFRWRLSTDIILKDIGWVVDDVRIYTCDTIGDELIFLPQVMKGHPYTEMVSGVPNGDFESGVTSWSEFSTFGFDLIISGTMPVSHHGGNWGVWLGGFNNETASISQQVLVPSDKYYLAYWHWIDSGESTCGNDVGSVLVNSTPIESYNLCVATETVGWRKRLVDLSSYSGLTVTLEIKATNNGSNISNLFIDDVAFQSLAPTLQETVPFVPPNTEPSHLNQSEGPPFRKGD